MRYLILFFIFLPAAELYLLIHIGKSIGFLHTLMLVIGTGILGSALLKWEGLKTFYQIRMDLLHGIVPGRKLLDGLLIMVAAVLLITPGVLTDMLGLLLIFPLTRAFVRERLLRYLERKFTQNSKIITVYPTATPDENQKKIVGEMNEDGNTDKIH